MTEQPSSQEVAEAVVRPYIGVPGFYVRTLRTEPTFHLLPSGKWDAAATDTYPTESAARAALNRAQEAAGVYPRPAGATCVCVVMRRLSPGTGPSVGKTLTPIFRRWYWEFGRGVDHCPVCVRGVPLPP